MTKARDKVARFDGSLYADAAVEGRRQSRSATQQLDYWARVGRDVTSVSTARTRRVRMALAGELSLAQLDHAEAVAFNAEVSAAIDANLASTDYGEALGRVGVTTVALDEEGNLVQHNPDGSTQPYLA